MAEAGIPDQESETFQGVLVPAGTPKEIVDLLHGEIVKLMQLPDVKAEMRRISASMSSRATQVRISNLSQKEIDKWHKVVG